MLTSGQSVKFIFGHKVRKLRQLHGLSFSDLSEKTGLSISFLNEIEKGKKYPKADKIIALAKALEVDYDTLVSLKFEDQQEGIAMLLNSTFFKEFPIEFFGIEPQKLLELVGESNYRVNAFIQAIIELVRNYDITKERFYHSALQAYQELNNNYFEEIEKQVRTFRKKFNTPGSIPVDRKYWYDLLEGEFGISINKLDLPQRPELKHIRSYYKEETKTFYINKGLNYSQVGFLQCRELAFQYFNFSERPNLTPPIELETFEEALNNFKASYFAVALLMDEKEVIRDIRKIAKAKDWSPELYTEILNKYDATPEMLLQRLTNLLPRHFDVKNLFFLRFTGRPKENMFRLTKELHLSGQHNPHANHLNEHYCRRWLAISSINHAFNKNIADGYTSTQLSTYIDGENTYYCVSIAKRNISDPLEYISVTLGFLVDDDLSRHMLFVKDKQIPRKTVHTTCERCPLKDCNERAAPSILLDAELSSGEILKALEKL